MDREFHGLVKQIVESESLTFPYRDGDKKGKIGPDDRYEIQSYHRIIDSAAPIDDDNSFGRSKSRRHVYRVRMVLMFKKLLPETERLLTEIIMALPDRIENEVEGYDLAEMNNEITVIHNHDTIKTEEFNDAWSDKFSKFILRAIEYNLEFIPCKTNCE